MWNPSVIPLLRVNLHMAAISVDQDASVWPNVPVFDEEPTPLMGATRLRPDSNQQWGQIAPAWVRLEQRHRDDEMTTLATKCDGAEFGGSFNVFGVTPFSTTLAKNPLAIRSLWNRAQTPPTKAHRFEVVSI